MKNKRKILFASIIATTILLGAGVLLKLKSDGILFSSKMNTNESLTANSILIGENISSDDKQLLLGDVNLDKTIDKEDVRYILRSLLKDEDFTKYKVTTKGEYIYLQLGDDNKTCADINKDGKVTIDDAIMLNRYVVTKPNTNNKGYLDTYVAEVDGITWMYDAIKDNGKYYADNVTYIKGYKNGDLVIPESFTNNYTWESRTLSKESFILVPSYKLSNDGSKDSNGIVIPKTIKTIADGTFESISGTVIANGAVIATNVNKIYFLERGGQIPQTVIRDDLARELKGDLKVIYSSKDTINNTYTGRTQVSPTIKSIEVNEQDVEVNGNTEKKLYRYTGSGYLMDVTVTFTGSVSIDSEKIPYLETKVGKTKLSLNSSKTENNKIIYTYYISTGINGKVTYGDSLIGENIKDSKGYYNIDTSTNDKAKDQTIEGFTNNLIQSVSIKSDNINPNIAKVGDTITLTIVCTDEIYNDIPADLVSIGGIFNTVEDGNSRIKFRRIEGSTYEATLIVKDSDSLVTDKDENVEIRLKTYKDAITKEEGPIINCTTDGSYVKINTKEPTINSIKIIGYEGSGNIQKSILKAGDRVEITVEMSQNIQPISSLPNIKIKFGDGENKRLTAKLKDNILLYTYTVQEGDNGKLEYIYDKEQDKRIGDTITQNGITGVLGDVDNDGEITDEDIELIQGYSVGLVSDKDQEAVIRVLGDTNQDGKITIDDVTCLQKFCIRKIGDTITNKGETIILGDIDGNGKIEENDVVVLARYLAKWDGYENIANIKITGDINRDGEVNEKDRMLLARHVAGWNYKMDGEGKVGDVNGNGKINIYDLQDLSLYLIAPSNVTINRELADINGDGKVDKKDKELLTLYLVASTDGIVMDDTGNTNLLDLTNKNTISSKINTNNIEADTNLPTIESINVQLIDQKNKKEKRVIDEETGNEITNTYVQGANLVVDVKFSEIIYPSSNNKIPQLKVGDSYVDGVNVTQYTDDKEHTTIRYKLSTNIKNGELEIFGLKSDASLYDKAGNKFEASIGKETIPYKVDGKEGTLNIDNTSPTINFKNQNTINGIIYTKYCDFINDNTITDNYFNDPGDIVLTLKNEFEEIISNYNNVKYTDLKEFKLQDGEYYMDLMDPLGNKKTVHFVVDNEVPVLNLIYQKAEDGHLEHVILDPNVDKNISSDRVYLYDVTNNIRGTGTKLAYNYLANNIVPVKDEEGNYVSKTYKIVATDYAGNTTTKFFTVDPNDIEVENVTVSYVKNEEGNVLATISSTEYLQEIDGWTLSSNKKSISKTYSENAIEVIQVEDLCGNIKDVTIKIDDLDKEVENVKVVYNKKENGITEVSISSTEELREVGNGWVISLDRTKLVKEFDKDAVETVRLTDLCGNTKDVTIKISSDDTEVTGIKVAYAKTEDGNVKATITASEELREVEGWTLSSDKRSLSKEYTDNAMETVTIEDLCGNTKDVIVKVDNTDNEVENVKVRYNKKENNVTEVIITADEELREVEGWTLSYDKRRLVREYTEDISSKVTVEDLCGNTKDVKFKVSKDDIEVTGVNVTYTQIEEGKVKATITADEELREVEGWTLSSDERSLSKEYTENTMETVTIEDLCANTKDVYIKIIDIESPVLTFERKTQYKYVTDDDEMVILVHSDDLMKLDEFKINDKDVTINDGTEYRNDFEVRTKVDSNMNEGKIKLSYICTYYDNNKGTKKGTTISDVYEIDRTKPTVESLVKGYSSNYSKEKTIVKQGDIVEFTDEFNEKVKLTEIPTLRIKLGNGEEKEVVKIKIYSEGQTITVNSLEELQSFIDGNIKFNKDENYFTKITYIYNVEQEDEGTLQIVYFNEKVQDMARNLTETHIENKTVNITADNTVPVITSIKVAPTSADNVYNKSNNKYIGTNKEIKFVVNTSETIQGTIIPTLVIKIGDGSRIELNNGVLDTKSITYTYTTRSDNGKVTIDSLKNGNITDIAGNLLDKTIPETDTKLYVDTQVLNITANLANGDVRSIAKNYLVYLKEFILGIEIDDLSGIKSVTLKNDEQEVSGYNLSHVIARDGNWTLDVTDNVGNKGTYHFVIDTTPPIIKLNGEDVNNIESIDDILIEIEDKNIDLDSAITLYKNGSKIPFYYQTQNKLYEAGNYRIVVKDKAGNITEKEFSVKREMPTVNMYLGDTDQRYTPGTWTNQPVRIELSVDPNDNVSEIEYRLSESDPWRKVTGNQLSITATGEYEFEARTKYNNNKYSTVTEKMNIKIDKVNPIIPDIIITPLEDTNLINGCYNGKVNITIPLGTDENSGVKNVVCDINGSTITSTKDISKTLGSSGIYNITYYNVDNAENKSENKTVKIMIDEDAPIITYLNKEDAVISGKAQEEHDYIMVDDNEIELNEFTYFNQYVKLKIEDLVSGINSNSLKLFKYDEEVKRYVEYTDMEIMRDGRYIITVEDNIGHRTSKGFVVDTTSPLIKINNDYPEVSENTVIYNYYNKDVEIDSLDNDASLKVYKQGNDGNYTDEVRFLNQIHKVTQDGSYKLIATDFIGNVTTVYFIIDRINPTMEVTPNTTDWTNEDVVLQIRATDEMSGIASIMVNDTQIAANNGVGSYSAIANGSYMILVTDNAGNQITQTITVNNIDKTLPGLAISGNPTTWTRGDVTFNISATDNESGIANVTVNGNKVTMNNGTGKYTVTENRNYTVVATDTAGNQKTETITVTKIDNVSPIIHSIMKNTEAQTDKVILTVSATDEMSGIAGYSWDNGQTWKTSNTYEVTKNGTYAVQVKDKVGNIAELSVTISNIKEAEETYFRISNYETKEKDNAKYVIGISTNTGLSLFKQYIETNMEYTILDKNGNTVGNDRIVATGMKIKVSDGREYTLVVRADLNSDGKADISDLSVMAGYLVGKGTLNTTYLLAGDLNNDGNVDITDISILAGAITKNIKL